MGGRKELPTAEPYGDYDDDATWAPEATPLVSLVGKTFAVLHAGLGTVVKAWERLGGACFWCTDESEAASKANVRATHKYVEGHEFFVTPDVLLTIPDVQGERQAGKMRPSSAQALADVAGGGAGRARGVCLRTRRRRGGGAGPVRPRRTR
jgi:hypothetical protein